MQQHAGKRVRHAAVLVEVPRGKPTLALRVWYGNLPFDVGGAIDRAQLRRDRLVLVHSPLDRFPARWTTHANLVIAGAKFIRRRVAKESQWWPTMEMHRRILALALRHSR